MQKGRNILFFIIITGIIIISFSSFTINENKEKINTDSLKSAKYIDGLIKYHYYFPFINYDKNYIEWANKTALDSFYQNLANTPKRKLKILHIGDSHIQADIFTGFIREKMQEFFGYGGRGFVFPYKAAKTHSAYDYKTSASGVWDYTRNNLREAKFDMGIVGATIHTSDSAAGFKIIFREGFIKENFSTLKLYCKQDSQSFDIKLKYSSENNPIYIDCGNNNSKKPYIQINLSKATDTLEFFINKTDTNQKFFECYGIMVENKDDNGLLYNSVGINGAGYKSILKQTQFGSQLNELDPDLVIIDLGANDFYGGTFRADELENNLQQIVKLIKTNAPNTNIIISNSQDIYYRRKRDIIQCKDFMDITKKVAFENNCGFYAYFNITGGRNSMNYWYKKGLAKRDKVHLTTMGYYVRGELFLNALLNSYELYLKRSNNDSLISDKIIIDTIQLKKYFAEDISFKSEIRKKEQIVEYSEPEQNGDDTDKIFYTIRSGDNLGSIAEKFGISVRNLQLWNGINGTKIIAGETLVIYKKNPPKPEPKQVKPAEKTTNIPVPVANTNDKKSPRKAAHKVVSGETLWIIANKYNTTVEKLKKQNNLVSDKLKIGQILYIP